MSDVTLVFHDSGDYLGVLRKRSGSLVWFDGPRTRDGAPVQVASTAEVFLVRGEVIDE